MATERDPLREWHRLFGLLLTDFFTDSPFTVEVERDLSQQQQFLDVVIVRRRRGRFSVRLPDGLTDLAGHNLVTFKSHWETLDAWTMKELISHHVTYRKLVSTSPTTMLPEDCFRLFAVCARFPQKLAEQVPWHRRQEGVYDCLWGTDQVRVVVAGELPREAHNAPLHLFSASPELVDFGSRVYQQHSALTSGLLRQLFTRFQEEGLIMAYTMKDFSRDYVKEHFSELSPEQVREILQTLPPEERLAGLPPEERLAGLSPEQIQQYLDNLTAPNPAAARRKGRKKPLS